MFCSRCGKTLNPDAPNCPHCGMALGDSRMIGHTSVQPSYMPQEQKREQSKYTPYTKTSYTSMVDTDTDVYSRTSYRPVLAVDNVPEPDEPTPDEEQPQADDAGADGEPFPGLKLSDAEVTPEQRASLEKLQAVPEDAPPPDEALKILEKELDIKVRPVTPIRKTGISPEVEGYIQRMEALKQRGKRKHDAAVDEGEGEGLSDVALGVPLDEKQAREIEKLRDRALRAGSPARKWVKRIAAVVAILVVMAGGLVYLAMTTQERSPIEGVSKQLYDAGLAVIEARMLPEYRMNIVSLAKNDTSFTSVLAQQEADMNEIKALKADAPMENDQAFVDALAGIQKAIGEAVVADALAAIAPTEDNVQVSNQMWSEIDNLVNRLKIETDIVGLTAVKTDAQAVEAPAPEPQETEPVTYTTLKRKDKGQAVKDMQTRLAELGWFSGVKDGVFGSYTRQIVTRFMTAAGMEASGGIATVEMQQLLYSDDAPRFTPGAQVDLPIESPAPAAPDAGDGTSGGGTAGDAGEDIQK